jgi:hypothetical protein
MRRREKELSMSTLSLSLCSRGKMFQSSFLLPQMILPSTGLRAFVDATDCATWMKFVRCADRDDERGINLRAMLIAGQIFYEVLRPICHGEELLLGPKRPLPLGFDASPSASTAVADAFNFRQQTGVGQTTTAPPSEGGGSARSSNPDDGGLTSGDDAGGSEMGNGRERGEALPAEDENDGDEGVKCLKCEKMFHDIFS